jgi:hypothetical protein
MLAFSDITSAVRKILLQASPKFLTVEEVLTRLPLRDALIAQLTRRGEGVGAEQAALSMVRDALNFIGAEMQFAFDPARPPKVKNETPEAVRIVYRIVELHP